MTADLLDLSALRGKKVLLTGHTGFKGAWLAIWLDLLGAEVDFGPFGSSCTVPRARAGRIAEVAHRNDGQHHQHDRDRPQQVGDASRPRHVSG